MDTSKEYIEMCRKAEEIQEHWIINKGDFIKIPYDSFPEPWCESLGWTGFDKPSNGIWLPRQDQLQDMIDVSRLKKNPTIPDIIFIFDAFNFWRCDINSYEYAQSFTTGEQPWLAFVMHERFNGKRWDGSDWVVE